MKKIILSIVALAAITITSCSSDDQASESQAQSQEQELSNKTGKNALLNLCTVTSTSVTVNRWQAPSSTYTNWTPVAATIGSVNVEWEGIYGASIRPVNNTDHWYVGTVTLDQTCADWLDWSSNIEVKNASANLGTAPTDKYNVLGYDGSISGTNYGLGYYSYNITTHIMTPSKAIVIWKIDDTGLNSQSVTDPSLATEAYLVKVTAVTPGSSSSTINYNWTKVL
ncbi:hypothetical protein [Flavobacterium sp. RS13.1]|jgi:hypothetical protein|uniref:hypothetical protein n=1 Tax=Flavobacterium sp. RS13.1 TaxID=3400345 RepID=UPI003AAEA590